MSFISIATLPAWDGRRGDGMGIDEYVCKHPMAQSTRCRPNICIVDFVILYMLRYFLSDFLSFSLDASTIVIHHSLLGSLWCLVVYETKKKETNAHIKVASSETNTVSPAANYPNCPVCSVNKVHALTKLSIVIDANEIKFGTSSQTSAAVVPHNSRANEIKQKQKCIWLVD